MEVWISPRKAWLRGWELAAGLGRLSYACLAGARNPEPGAQSPLGVASWGALPDSWPALATIPSTASACFAAQPRACRGCSGTHAKDA